MNITSLTNQNNVESVREQIMKKKSYNPYHTTVNIPSNVLTDYDNFPYQRYWRGVPNSYDPVVAEREAGYRPRHDACYKTSEPMQEVPKPNLCFQSACSTIYPCNSEYNRVFKDREAHDEFINKNCIVQYR